MISFFFHCVLRVIIALERELLSNHRVESSHLKYLTITTYFIRFSMYHLIFTQSIMLVPRTKASRYHGKKGYPTQNIFVACDFNIKFTYILVGWECTTFDSRILRDTITREDPLIIHKDVDFMLKCQILPWFRNVRYHLKEYSVWRLQNYKELFNLCHSSL
ncbi:hypothetical protein CR513_35919, partial [Mucuna pruriens]